MSETTPPFLNWLGGFFVPELSKKGVVHMSDKKNVERDLRKEVSRLRKRIAYLENRVAELEGCGLEVDLEELMRDIEVVEKKLPEPENVGLSILQRIKKERMNEIGKDN